MPQYGTDTMSDPADLPDNKFPRRTRKNRPMDDTKLMSAIREFEQESYGFSSGQLASARSYAIERYLALPYGDEVDGRSAVVDTGLRDIVEWLLPQVLRVFLSGQQVVQFEPTAPEDEVAARQETDFVNHVILEKNDSFSVFSTWFRDALISKVGYVKARWEERRDVLGEQYKGLTDDMLMVLQADKAVELISLESYPDPLASMGQPIPSGGPPTPMAAPPAPPMPAIVPQQLQPSPPPPMLHDAKVRRVKTHGYVAIDNVPPEEMYVHRSLRTINLEQCQFLQHRARRTLSELRQDGYELDDDIPTSGDDAGEVNDQITISRDRFADDEALREDLAYIDPAARRVWFRESYIRVDYDGDGVAELRRVCHIGNKIIANEELDLIPFAAVTPIIFPHRHIGIGYDDLCDQPSKIATAIQRGYLDNLYLKNNGRYGVNVDNVNVDDMLVSRPGGLVRTRGNPGDNIFPFQHPDAGASALEGLQWAKQQLTMATGVTPDQADMSADVLKGNTATGVAAAVSAGQSRVESVTRAFATGVKELFGIVHALTLKNATSDERLKLNNEWVAIDPREWVKRTAMTITVGLGTGTKESRIQQYMMLGQLQAQGLQLKICSPQNLFETGKRITEEMGHRNAEAFWTDPSKTPPSPPEPPPEVQVEQMRGQTQMQMAQMKGQLDQQTEQARLQAQTGIEAAQAQADVATQQHKAAVERQTEIEKFTLQMQADAAKHEREQHTQIMVANIKAANALEIARVGQQIEDGKAVLQRELKDAGQGDAAAMLDAVGQLNKHLEVLSGPKEFVLGPDKKIAGVKYSDGTIKNVARGPDGRATGLQ